MSTPDRFYVTTPIYYVNALPHLGTFYTTAVADALARFHRLRGDDVFFLTGLDEHGQKIERIARDRGLALQAYCDGIAAQFQATWKSLSISNDDFIRTTQARHKAAVAEMWQLMVAKGDIYEKDYDSLYCVGCEEFKTNDDVVEEDGVTICPIHRKPVERVQEKNYFFRLSAYADKVLAWYDSADPVWPTSRRNEVTEFVKRGLQDISVSRPSVKWGIPVPNDPSHTVYVWIDALTNYLTVLGGPEAVAVAVAKGEGKGAFWLSAHHMIAKDILRFHAVYWPAMLMSAGLPRPQKILCHGYLTLKGEKIAKSVPATKVDPVDIANELGVDPLRYFLMREYTFGGDGDFTYEALLQRYESDLGNDLGNLLNRTVSMARQYLGGVVPAFDFDEKVAQGQLKSTATKHLIEVSKADWKEAPAAWQNFAPSRALTWPWHLAQKGNQYIEQTKPWVVARKAKTGDAAAHEELVEILSTLCEALRRIAIMISPAMPATAEAILAQLGLPPLYPSLDAERLLTSAASRKPAWRIGADDSEDNSWHWEPGTPLGEPRPLFPRLDPERKAALLARWTGEAESAAAAAVAKPEWKPASKGPAESQTPVRAAAPAAGAPTGAASPATAGGGADVADAGPVSIAIEDFAKIELRAAKVLSAERVPKTEKLLKLTLDLGTEQRTVVSGIAAAYSPEDMVGRTIIYLANLKPAKIRGVVSQGMILAAGDHDVLALSALDREVPPGTLIR